MTEVRFTDGFEPGKLNCVIIQSNGWVTLEYPQGGKEHYPPQKVEAVIGDVEYE